NSLTGRHPVIGDPGDENEGVPASDRNGPRGGGPGSLGGTTTRGGGSRGGSRKYKNADTSRPDGFLLYYTGDFGTQLVDFIDSRRND
ncbi:MAG: hypothetical protein AAGA30_11025, partial [Planctomycetota bacterium]